MKIFTDEDDPELIRKNHYELELERITLQCLEYYACLTDGPDET